MAFDPETALMTGIPLVLSIIIYGIRVESRLTRLETKLNLIMAYFHLQPAGKGGEKED